MEKIEWAINLYWFQLKHRCSFASYWSQVFNNKYTSWARNHKMIIALNRKSRALYEHFVAIYWAQSTHQVYTSIAIQLQSNIHSIAFSVSFLNFKVNLLMFENTFIWNWKPSAFYWTYTLNQLNNQCRFFISDFAK